MARVTVEDCIDKLPNRFELVLLSAHRARMISQGAPLSVERDNDKNPVVALREDRITAYALALNLWPRNHAVANDEEDMKALLLGAAAMNSEALSLLLPVRQASLFRWCLSQGYRAVMPMTLMALGEYREPNGCYIPSVLY